ncbi:MAG: TAXI family TRAP transporter solute-binding subunit [Clostridia bacterium]|nr:MAG: TAXI family TRAP transporter solute-binding subunit [Clostridia bacterium]
MATSAEAAGEAAAKLGFPVAVKGVCYEITHKTEAGGVDLNLSNAEEVQAAFALIRSRMLAYHPGATWQGVMVEKMAPPGARELIVGVKRDVSFGPVVMVGLGGVWVEVLHDVALRVAPVDEREALRMWQELKAFPLLDSFRGQGAVEMKALTQIVRQVSVLAMDWVVFLTRRGLILTGGNDMRPRFLVFSVLVLLVAGMVWLSGCGGAGTQGSGESAGGKPAQEAQSGGVEGKGEPGATQTPSGGRTTLTYVTNPAGSDYYTVAVGQAQVVSRHTNIDINVQPTPGPATMPGLVASGEAQLANGAGYNVWEAYQGVGSADKPYPMIRALQAGHDTLFAFITTEATGIKTIADTKGHKVTTDYPGMRLLSTLGPLELKAYGLEPGKDVTILKAENTSKALQDLAEGRTEVAMASVQGPKIEELASKVKIRVLPFEADKMPVVEAEMPSVYSAVTSKGLTAIEPGIPIVRTPAVVWTTSELAEDVAYSLVKTLIERQDELIPIAPDTFNQYGADKAVQPLPVPYHPGAVKYYKEKGLWSDEMDKHQEQVLQAAKE